MALTVAEVAKVLEVDGSQVKEWSTAFKDYLGPAANPPKGTMRGFSDTDMLALVYVAHHWELDPDLDAIAGGLNAHEHFGDYFREMLRLRLPIFQDPPDELDESCTHGSLIGGMLQVDYKFTDWWIADSYRKAADTLVDSVLVSRSNDAREVVWPVLFLYRHSLELYLKLIVQPPELNHSLEPLFEKFEKIVQAQYCQTIPQPIMDRCRELAKMDPGSFAFRYAKSKSGSDSIQGGEYWVEVQRIRELMDVLAPAFHRIGSPNAREDSSDQSCQERA